MQVLMRMSTPLPASWHIVKIIHSPDFKGDVPGGLDKGQVPARVGDSRQFDDSAFLDVHGKNSSIRSDRPRRYCLPHGQVKMVFDPPLSFCPHWQTKPRKRAGLPMTSVWSATPRVTTAPAPTIAQRPTDRPGRMVAWAPMLHPRRSTVAGYCCGYCLLRGRGSFVNAAQGPIRTSSSTTVPSQRYTPHLMVTRSAIRTLPSRKVWSQMLQSSPITAPDTRCAKAQTRLPFPILTPSSTKA